jgi:thymidylate synthase (FAD)
MEFLVAGYEIIEQKPGLQGIYEACELPGRICYGSQDKIEPGSAEPFVKRLMASNHGAPLEHGTVYLIVPQEAVTKYMKNPYSKVTYSDINQYNQEYTDSFYWDDNYVELKYYVTTNLRVLVENDWLDDLQYLCDEPTEYHEKRVMVRFTMDRFTGEEFLRHRKASFNRESTRYVAFTKEKFGGGSIKYIIPTWMLDRTDEIDDFKNMSIVDFCRNVIDIENGDMECISDIFVWEFALKATEWSYNKLMNSYDWKAQQARTVLPCAINSPLIKTAFISDWKHFFNLRAIGTTGAPHPQAKELAEPLMNDFKELGLI